MTGEPGAAGMLAPAQGSIGRWRAHPIVSSPLLHCPFHHNTTLQHYRLQSVTTNVTRRSSKRLFALSSEHEDMVVAPRMWRRGSVALSLCRGSLIKGKPTIQVGTTKKRVVPGRRGKRGGGTPCTLFNNIQA